MQTPKHSKCARHVESGLFRGVASFVELEARIAALTTELERGDAFEVFAEGYLATQRVPQAKHIWPGDTVPLDIVERLRLPLRDMGVDGVFETLTSEFTPYQVKFRTERPSLGWGEISTFFGLVDTGCQRLLFTNCDDISEVAESRTGAVFIRGNDLERLNRDDLEAIAAWLCGVPTRAARKEPMPHQDEALADIIAALETKDRATALMACGTGKTLVALWVAERLSARTILVLVPSLALVRQTLHQWLHETNLPELTYLCVCSDPTVDAGEDALLVRPAELDFRVTTTPDDVRRFLAILFRGVKVVFSTYQSSAVVAAGAAGFPPFNLAVFDEAHKTASRIGVKFALALDDAKLPIAKRLFLTATPRHYKVGSKDKFGDARIVFSMDAPDVYGPVAHRLPFSTAAKLGIITDYKILVTFVTSEMVTNELLRRGVVLVKNEEIKARQVANQIALQSAVERYSVKKIFTFHSRVDAAKSFTASGAEGLGNHLPGFFSTHINGEMPTAHRERRMRQFESAPQAVMSNARCLTEGVDVPAVDMVAFLSPRRSVVDIVQATGRAMRRSSGKQFGYVLVPLYVEQMRGETPEEAVIRSDFREVWKVLQALKEQDDLLTQIISDMCEQRGRTGGFDDSRLREKIDLLPPELALDSLRKFITAACLDAIGETWFERYGQLVAYYERFGTCEMPHRTAEDKRLATWVINQRVLRKEGSLTEEKIELLNRIGFKWEPKAGGWRGKYLELLQYRELHGDCRVPQNRVENKSLAHWVSRQRYLRSQEKLSQTRILQLERLGFDWTLGLATWDERFEELCQ